MSKMPPKNGGFGSGYSGLVVVIHGHEEVFFEFNTAKTRDDCEVMVLRVQERFRDALALDQSQSSSSYDMDTAKTKLFAANDAVVDKRLNLPPTIPMEQSIKDMVSGPEYKRHFTMLTIGSRGDVQPYLALCLGLMKEGHTTRIATHLEFKDWIEGYGIEFREIAGDPGELMKIMVEHGMFSVSFIREASSKFRSWIDDLLVTSWEACQGTDVLIESPSAMAGIHVAEALEIPYFRAFTMPWTRTRAYPHAFIVPEQKMGGSYNFLTYVLFDNVFWKGIAGQVNKWRVNQLGLQRTSLDQLAQTKVPFLYNVSPSIFVPPVDFSDWVRVTGYWFLDEGGGDNYEPPGELQRFMDRARRDHKKLVYIGFGSIVVNDPKGMTEAIVKAVQKADVRCLLNKGWSDRFEKKGKQEASEPEVPLPECILQVDNIPHDWLFPNIDAAVHHGGSGTTGASLRAGLPTIIKPFFGDQFFYAGRVEDLGAGIHLKKLTVDSFAKALKEATTSSRIISKAGSIGRHIRTEDGVSQAIISIYQNYDYARQLSAAKAQKSKKGEQTGGIGVVDTAITGAKAVETMASQMLSDVVSDSEGSDSEDTIPENVDGSWTIVGETKLAS